MQVRGWGQRWYGTDCHPIWSDTGMDFRSNQCAGRPIIIDLPYFTLLLLLSHRRCVMNFCWKSTMSNITIQRWNRYRPAIRRLPEQILRPVPSLVDDSANKVCCLVPSITPLDFCRVLLKNIWLSYYSRGKQLIRNLIITPNHPNHC
jgi:hypothetical protein